MPYQFSEISPHIYLNGNHFLKSLYFWHQIKISSICICINLISSKLWLILLWKRSWAKSPSYGNYENWCRPDGALQVVNFMWLLSGGICQKPLFQYILIKNFAPLNLLGLHHNHLIGPFCRFINLLYSPAFFKIFSSFFSFSCKPVDIFLGGCTVSDALSFSFKWWFGSIILKPLNKSGYISTITSMSFFPDYSAKRTIFSLFLTHLFHLFDAAFYLLVHHVACAIWLLLISGWFSNDLWVWRLNTVLLSVFIMENYNCSITKFQFHSNLPRNWNVGYSLST